MRARHCEVGPATHQMTQIHGVCSLYFLWPHRSRCTSRKCASGPRANNNGYSSHRSEAQATDPHGYGARARTPVRLLTVLVSPCTMARSVGTPFASSAGRKGTHSLTHSLELTRHTFAHTALQLAACVRVRGELGVWKSCFCVVWVCDRQSTHRLSVSRGVFIWRPNLHALDHASSCAMRKPGVFGVEFPFRHTMAIVRVRNS